MIDTCGLSCPEPVIMVKKAMESGKDSYTVIADNRTAFENISRFANHQGFTVSSEIKGEIYTINLEKK